MSTLLDVYNYKLLFKNLFESAKYNNVDPSSVIAFTGIRFISQTVVKSLLSLYDKSSFQPDGIENTNFAHGSETPIVVPLHGSIQYIFHTCSEITDILNQSLSQSWYCSPSGRESSMSNIPIKPIVGLSRTERRGGDFKWFVTVLEAWLSQELYCQLARFLNTLHSPRFNIQLKFFDELNNMRKKYDRLSSDGSKPSNTLVLLWNK